MAKPLDQLGSIAVRKQAEVERRRRRAAFFSKQAARSKPSHAPEAMLSALRRPADTLPRVIAEIKLRSPSAGQLRERSPGGIPRIAAGYAVAGAAAVSVLCDGPGFGGNALDLRRVARAVSVPILFKEFVLDPVQLDLARAAGASFALLLLRLLDDQEVAGLIDAARERGLEPVVEAADAHELERALRTRATVIGVNARDLRDFSVDPSQASALIDQIPRDRVAVFMSGVRSSDDLSRVAATRADAVLIGEGLIRADDPGARLAAWLATAAVRGA